MNNMNCLTRLATPIQSLADTPVSCLWSVAPPQAMAGVFVIPQVRHVSQLTQASDT
jgi:hypothetical protein